MRLPFVESITRHRGADFSYIAGWLFDCLDQLPPPPGGRVTLYLCFHEVDHGYFSAATCDEQIKQSLIDRYRTELTWDGQGFGDLRFDLKFDGARNKELFFCPRKSVPPTQIDIRWSVERSMISPNSIGLVRRWTKALTPDEMLVARLTIEGQATFAPHLDYWQKDIRWLKPVIYFSSCQNVLIIGSRPGNDIMTGFDEELIINFDGRKRLWTWSFPSSPHLLKGSSQSNFRLEYPQAANNLTIKLFGEIIEPPLSVGAQEDKNRLPSFTLAVAGWILPLPYPLGYGTVPDDFPLSSEKAASAVALPDGNWLYLNKEDNKPYLIKRGGAPFGTPLRSGDSLVFNSPLKNREQLRLIWRDGGKVKSKEFYDGGFELDSLLAVRLSYGANKGDFPDDFFIEHIDSAFGTAPVVLKSNDGRRYSMTFKEKAQHPVFVISNSNREAHSFSPQVGRNVDLGDTTDFILGTMHYKLFHDFRTG